MADWFSVAALFDRGWKWAALVAGVSLFGLVVPIDSVRELVDPVRGYLWFGFFGGCFGEFIFGIEPVIEDIHRKRRERQERIRRFKEARVAFLHTGNRFART